MSRVDVIGLFRQAALEVHGKELGPLDATTEISTLGLDSVAVPGPNGAMTRIGLVGKSCAAAGHTQAAAPAASKPRLNI